MAKQVSIRIKLINNHKTLFISVFDHRKRFRPNSEALGIRLIGTKERVATFKGKIRIHSFKDKRMRISIAILINTCCALVCHMKSWLVPVITPRYSKDRVIAL